MISAGVVLYSYSAIITLNRLIQNTIIPVLSEGSLDTANTMFTGMFFEVLFLVSLMENVHTAHTCMYTHTYNHTIIQYVCVCMCVCACMRACVCVDKVLMAFLDLSLCQHVVNILLNMFVIIQ